MTGSIQILGADRMELGSWPLDVVEKSPVETDLVMDGSELGVRKVLKVKITAFKAGQLPELVAQTKREIGSVDDERKAANKKLGEMRQKAKPPPTAAGDTAIVAQKKTKNSIWKKVLVGPTLLFQTASMIFNTPLKEIAYFGIGVALLMYKGDDLLSSSTASVCLKEPTGRECHNSCFAAWFSPTPAPVRSPELRGASWSGD
eukprot:CAMPEP_0171643014 /NCGR_PEP_ID=MMETSP0990-20121206/32370_1 /TAXON_ID=483369 /ORGANISM="non described non described, Strain CCMP2098" /LENGTH=201 /DNA_ID=CAMNT_0012218489 /DNA_START=318 /DNA_END=924 /DNA_ORIENTATION=+